MDPSPEGRAPGETAEGPLAEPVPVAGRGHPGRVMLASLTAIVVLAGVVGGVIVAAGDEDHATPRLVLAPGGRTPGKARDSSALAPIGAMPYRYKFAGAFPDLGTDAPVARLQAPDVDDARVEAMARALGLTGTLRTQRSADGRIVIGNSAVLNVSAEPGGWAISFSYPAVDPGVPGSTGGGSAPSAGSDSAPDAVPPDAGTSKTTVVVDPAPPPPPVAPADLPSEAEAETIARTLLDRMGVAGDWSVTVDTTNGADAVACSPEPCAVLPADTRPTSRFVTLTPRFEGVTVDGLSWQVQLGDHGRVESLWGTLTELRTLGRYPLQSVASVFADLVAGRGIDPNPIALAEIAPDGAEPFHEIAPLDVTIDGVTIGYAVMPASDDGRAVVDLVPTYVFSGKTENGDEVSRSLIAVEASVTTLSTAPGPGTTDPGATDPPLGKPEPQPMPVEPSPTVAGKPLP